MSGERGLGSHQNEKSSAVVKLRGTGHADSHNVITPYINFSYPARCCSLKMKNIKTV
jgi:hypothetical protein